MNICFATSECTPFVKTGGLGDVSAALPKELAAQGHHVKLFVPLYSAVDREKHGIMAVEGLSDLSVKVGSNNVGFSVWKAPSTQATLQVLFIYSRLYFDRPEVYSNATDEAERYLVFQLGILKALQKMNWPVDIIHANDWPTALLPVYLHESHRSQPVFSGAASVLSIHNIGYQGFFPIETLRAAGLAKKYSKPGGAFEFYGGFSFLKAGICFADVVATVSPSYAIEIQTPEHGHGLDGVLRSIQGPVRGILNGIDETVWNPEIDRRIVQTYDVRSLEKKAANKKALLDQLGLPASDDLPVIGIISRFTSQKGFNLLEPVLEQFLEAGQARFVILGSGDPNLEAFFLTSAARFPAHLAVKIGYDETLAHQIEAGVDIFLMPSLYEPCGLNQMYSLRYGTVPVVRRTGGLADTIVDIEEDFENGNGFSFVNPEPDALAHALRRAISRYGDKRLWRLLQVRGMQTDFSWRTSSAEYVELYRTALLNTQTSVKKIPTGWETGRD